VLLLLFTLEVGNNKHTNSLSILHAEIEYKRNNGLFYSLNFNKKRVMYSPFDQPKTPLFLLYSISACNIDPYDISGKLIYHKIGMHNRSVSLKTGKQRHSKNTRSVNVTLWMNLTLTLVMVNPHSSANPLL
jgi:hypothetical protein